MREINIEAELKIIARRCERRQREAESGLPAIDAEEAKRILLQRAAKVVIVDKGNGVKEHVDRISEHYKNSEPMKPIDVYGPRGHGCYRSSILTPDQPAPRRRWFEGFLRGFVQWFRENLSPPWKRK